MTHRYLPPKKHARSATGVLSARRIIAEVQRFSVAERERVYHTAVDQLIVDEVHCIWCGELMPHDDHQPYCSVQCGISAGDDNE